MLRFCLDCGGSIERGVLASHPGGTGSGGSSKLQAGRPPRVVQQGEAPPARPGCMIRQAV